MKHVRFSVRGKLLERKRERERERERKDREREREREREKEREEEREKEIRQVETNRMTQKALRKKHHLR